MIAKLRTEREKNLKTFSPDTAAINTDVQPTEVAIWNTRFVKMLPLRLTLQLSF